MHTGNNMIKYAIPLLVLFAFAPAFAQTYNCPNGCTVTMTQNPAPVQTNTVNNIPYYKNPDPSINAFQDLVNTFFNKLGQGATQIAGGSNSQYGSQVQNMTGSVQQVVDTGIDYVSAIKYLVASLFGLIVPKLFGIAVPSYLLPVIEWSMVGIMAYAIWKKGWEIFLTAFIIGVIVILVILFGGVFFH